MDVLVISCVLFVRLASPYDETIKLDFISCAVFFTDSIVFKFSQTFSWFFAYYPSTQ